MAEFLAVEFDRHGGSFRFDFPARTTTPDEVRRHVVAMAREGRSKLGEGGFGSVWKASAPGGAECAHQIINDSQAELRFPPDLLWLTLTQLLVVAVPGVLAMPTPTAATRPTERRVTISSTSPCERSRRNTSRSARSLAMRQSSVPARPWSRTGAGAGPWTRRTVASAGREPSG